MNPQDVQHENVVIAANEHIDPEGSVVRSGMLLADVVLRSLDKTRMVDVDLEGMRGVSSSYFNVFLRQIQDEIGLDEFGDRVRLRFGSKVQEDIFHHSFDAIRRSQRNTPAKVDINQNDESEISLIWRWAARLRFWKKSR